MSAPSYSVIQFLLNQMRVDEGDLAGGSVYFYSPGTTETTGIKVYLDKDGSQEANNPYTLDGDGTAQLYAAGSYRVVVKDANGVTQYDRDNVYFNAGSDFSYTVSVGDYADLDAAVTAIGSDATRLLIDKAITVTADLTVPGNIVLEQIEPGTITVNPGQTLTIVTAPIASSRQWFLGSGTVTVSGYPKDQVWWGNAQRTDSGGYYIKTASVLASPYAMQNVSFTASVGSKALTVALKGVNGNNPSSSNPVHIAFRSATATSSIPVVRTVTGATSVVLSSGSTLGFGAGETSKIYVWAIDYAGTIELALSKTVKWSATERVTTTAEGGAGAADSATTLYSTTARTNVACRLLGNITIATGATAGQWDNAPTVLALTPDATSRGSWTVQYADDSGELQDVALGAQYYALISNGAAAAPTMQAVGESILASASVSQAKLKTSLLTATVGTLGSGWYSAGEQSMGSAAYGFTPYVVTNNAGDNISWVVGQLPMSCDLSGTVSVGGSVSTNLTTGVSTYVSWAGLGTAGYQVKISQRYVTSSGEINWFFILRDKTTKEIKRLWFSSDHPLFHAGVKSQAEHPWMNLDIEALGLEVLCMNPDQKTVESDLIEDEDADDWIDIFYKKYEIDEGAKVSWPKELVTVGLPKVLTDSKTGLKRRVDDWRYEKIGMSIAPVKQLIPQPKTVILKGFKVKAEVK